MGEIYLETQGEQMTKGKLSLVAALALTTGLQAADIKYDERLGVTTAVDKGYTEELVKDEALRFDGQLRFWYQTMDHGGALSNGTKDSGLFQRQAEMGNEWGNVEAQFSISGKVNDHLKAKGTFMAISTMGMENLITSAQTARTGSTGALDGTSAQPFWVHEAYLDYVFTKNTDVKVGRMELNTPLVFTEKWNATANAFEAITATNTDLANTTLTAAYIAKGNGAQSNLRAAPQVFGAEANFNNLAGYTDANGDRISDGGVLAVGVNNSSLDFMPVQAWGYFSDSLNGYWVQADASAKDVGPLSAASLQLIGAGLGTSGATEDYLKSGVFSNPTPNSGGASSINTKTAMTNAVAGKVAASTGIFNAYAAASQTTKGNLPIANIGTNYKKTKLPTASIFNDGMVVAQPNTTAWKIGGGMKLDGIGVFGLSYGSSLVGQNEGYQNTGANVGGPASMGYIAQNFVQDDIKVNEIDVTYNTKIKDVDLAVMYIKVNHTYVPILGANGGPNVGTSNSFSDYGTFDNDIVRVVATLKF